MDDRMGGIALGNEVKSNGLMDMMDDVTHRMLEGRALLSSSFFPLSSLYVFPFPRSALFLVALTLTNPSHPLPLDCRLSRHLLATRSQ